MRLPLSGSGSGRGSWSASPSTPWKTPSITPSGWCTLRSDISVPRDPVRHAVRSAVALRNGKGLDGFPADARSGFSPPTRLASSGTTGPTSVVEDNRTQ